MSIIWNYSVKLFEFGSVVQEEMSLLKSRIFSSYGPRVRWSKTLYAVLVECIMGNIYVKLY